jgi:hypothetical protein
MICARCGSSSVTWRGPIANLTHTECGSCGGRNCQVFEDELGDGGPCALCADGDWPAGAVTCPRCDADVPPGDLA